jgi:hypothetical protein
VQLLRLPLADLAFADFLFDPLVLVLQATIDLGTTRMIGVPGALR